MPQTTAPLPSASTQTIRLEEKHPAAIRWMHWLNFPLLFLMIFSGLMIYWADSIPSQGNLHRAYRIGFGHFTLIRLFPDGFYRIFFLSHRFHQGIGFHSIGMWLFTANGLIYVLFLAISGQWRHILPDRRSLAQLGNTMRTELTGRHAPHAGEKYSPAQRIAYTLILLMGAGSVITGLAIWKPTTLHFITALCGGYQTARWLHFWLTLAFCLFFFVHVAQVLRAGWNNLRGMISGAVITRVEPIPAEISPLPAVRLQGFSHE